MSNNGNYGRMALAQRRMKAVAPVSGVLGNGRSRGMAHALSKSIWRPVPYHVITEVAMRW